MGALLRRLRKTAGLSGQELAARLEVSQSHLSRVELGDATATVELVGRWLAESGASEADRAAALELAEAVAVVVGTWKDARSSGLAKIQRDAAEAEAAATASLAFVPSLVPGLMQTPDYATALVAGDHPDRVDIAEAVAARMQRQVVLYSPGKTLRWVIGEAGLRWRMGSPSVMAAQLDRIAELAGQPHLDVRVLPFARTREVWHDHGFTIDVGRIDGEPDLVHVELLTGPVNITDPSQVAQYVSAFDTLAALCLAGAEAAAFIRRIREQEYRP